MSEQSQAPQEPLDPRKLLEDPEILATLIAEEPAFKGRNIVDLRGL